jgi:putative tryptophan/tyrosine transport system substrate-binding protein
MKRREFIAGLGSATAWPIVARAQQGERVRRIGILWPQAESDPVRMAWDAGLRRGLAQLGWAEGRNLRIDRRWNPATAEQARMLAKELIDQRPEVLLTATTRLTRAVQEETQTIPIVIMGAGDPLASGLVKSLSHPEGNTTGATDYFPSLAGKWLEILKDCVPGVVRVALISNPDRGIPANAVPALEAGRRYSVKTVEASVRNAEELKRAIETFAAEPDGGLIILPPPFPASERQLINELAVQHRLPVIYQDKAYAVEGGLLSYGADLLDMIGRDVPPYVDRILRGEKPSDLPIQFSTKFTLVVNLKTAKAMGLTISEAFLNLANEVIE